MGVQLITFLIAPCIYCMVKEWQFHRISTTNSQRDAIAGTWLQPFTHDSEEYEMLAKSVVLGDAKSGLRESAGEFVIREYL